MHNSVNDTSARDEVAIHGDGRVPSNARVVLTMSSAIPDAPDPRTRAVPDSLPKVLPFAGGDMVRREMVERGCKVT
jgi:hypothetical protein